MDQHIHVHVHLDGLLGGLEAKLDALIAQGEENVAAIDRIREEVAELKTVNQSASTLLSRLAEEIRTNAGNEDALNALADEIDAENSGLAAAVSSNTPAESGGGGEPTDGGGTSGF